MRPLAAVLLAIACLGAAPARPNIVVILADDMGYSDLACYGGEVRTPNLDALAAGGLRFTQFYNTARCCPTRASLLTGLYPHQAAVGHMMEDKGLDAYRGDLSKNAATIAEVLRPAGYGTYMIGKWHVTRHAGPAGPKDNWPRARGFDRFYGTITGAGSYYDPGTLTRDDDMISPLADPQYKPARYYYTEAISDHAVRFITEHKRDRAEAPLFLYVAYTAAHWPMHALEEDVARYKGRYDAGYAPVRQARLERMRQMGLLRPEWAMSPQAGDWDKVKDKAWEARCMEVYAAMIDRMDAGVGRIVEALRAQGMLDDTLILYLQDNGGCQETVGRAGSATRPAAPTLAPIAPDAIRVEVIPRQTRSGFPVIQGGGALPGPDDTYIAYGEGWANVSNTPFREYKHFVHEGGISTPLIAHWPRGIPNARWGKFEHQPGHLIDVMPTCVALSGATYPAKAPPMEGRSLVTAFYHKRIERDAIYWEHEGNRAVRVGDWKLVAKGPAGAWELYDLAADRTEQKDLASANPEKVAELAAKWEAWAKRTGATPWPWKPPYGQKVAPPQRTFDLKAGANLAGDEAPQVTGKPLTLTAIIEARGDGVIVAQGGTAHGFALWVRGGKPELALRHGGTLTTLAGPAALPRGKITVGATVARDGAMKLLIDGKPVAEGKGPGPLRKQPVDGLQVGRDLAGMVGEYEALNRFDGTIESVRVELGE